MTHSLTERQMTQDVMQGIISRQLSNQSSEHAGVAHETTTHFGARAGSRPRNLVIMSPLAVRSLTAKKTANSAHTGGQRRAIMDSKGVRSNCSEPL
jgi:hypothetical protein